VIYNLSIQGGYVNNLFDKLGRAGAIVCLFPTSYFIFQFFIHRNHGILAIEMVIWFYFWLGFVGSFWGLAEDGKPNKFLGWLFLTVGFVNIICALSFTFSLISRPNFKYSPIIKEFVVSLVSVVLGAFSVAKSNLSK
jgi:hypothetical protein